MSDLSPEEKRRIEAHAAMLANRSVLQRLYSLLDQFDAEEGARRQMLPRVLSALALAVSLLIVLILLY
jgi:hypothetical protein